MLDPLLWLRQGVIERAYGACGFPRKGNIDLDQGFNDPLKKKPAADPSNNGSSANEGRKLRFAVRCTGDMGRGWNDHQ